MTKGTMTTSSNHGGSGGECGIRREKETYEGKLLKDNEICFVSLGLSFACFKLMK